VTGIYRVDRRTLLADLGRGAVAVAVLGWTACSGDDDGEGPAASASSSSTRPARAGRQDADRLVDQRVSLGFVSAYVLVRGREAAVVDTGVAGSAPQIEDGLEAVGKSWEDVRHLILTHHHPDHAGSVAAVMEAATGARAYAGAEDIPSIDAPRELVAVGDGEEVFGLRVVTTPGHTAGHIAVLDPDTGLLVAGDALNNSERLGRSPPRFTADPAAGDESVRKLADLDVQRILFGHGDPLEQGAVSALRDLAASLSGRATSAPARTSCTPRGWCC
jgi:glyoxylase-like metal-dependent hydrolase (beta-lactamase superfamily II)